MQLPGLGGIGGDMSQFLVEVLRLWGVVAVVL